MLGKKNWLKCDDKIELKFTKLQKETKFYVCGAHSLIIINILGENINQEGGGEQKYELNINPWIGNKKLKRRGEI